MSLAARRFFHERMDDPALPAEEHRLALRGLARLHRLGRSGACLWKPLAALARKERPLRVLDLATGGGALPLALWRRARRAGVALEVEGWDRSARAVEYARAEAARAGAMMRFRSRDVLREDLPEGFHAITCALFLHHLAEEDAVALLARMAAAARNVVLVLDLHRSRPALLLAYAAARLVTRSRVVHEDAALSVRNAFTAAEAVDLARRAGLPAANVCPCRPLRWLLSWERA